MQVRTISSFFNKIFFSKFFSLLYNYSIFSISLQFLQFIFFSLQPTHGSPAGVSCLSTGLSRDTRCLRHNVLTALARSG